MITYKKMEDCTFADALYAWNKGFTGYFFNVTMTSEQFLKRFITEGLSLKHSLLAFNGNQPIGILLSGFRQRNDVLFAWNGGTAVAEQFRGTGVAKELVAKSLQLYKEEGVNIATLEAISNNEKAIALYKNNGYEVDDLLVILQNKGKINFPQVQLEESFAILECHPAFGNTISFYPEKVAWQTQVESLKDGKMKQVMKDGNTIAYAIYKENFNNVGEITAVTLYQCEVDQQYQQQERAIINTLCEKIFRPEYENITRMLFNVSEKNAVVAILKEVGFLESVKQLYMVNKLT
jgi:GNAT superfamily N-acetyltransferase